VVARGLTTARCRGCDTGLACSTEQVRFEGESTGVVPKAKACASVPECLRACQRFRSLEAPMKPGPPAGIPAGTRGRSEETVNRNTENN
jgi:hypothetical protein